MDTSSICTRNIYKATDMTVNSRIIDIDTGLPIESVNVYLKNNPTIGTITNADGYFNLQADPLDEIVMSHVTYGAIEIPAADIESTEYFQPKINDLGEVDLGMIQKPQQAGFSWWWLLLLGGLYLGTRKNDKTVKASI